MKKHLNNLSPKYHKKSLNIQIEFDNFFEKCRKKVGALTYIPTVDCSIWNKEYLLSWQKIMMWRYEQERRIRLLKNFAVEYLTTWKPSSFFEWRTGGDRDLGHRSISKNI